MAIERTREEHGSDPALRQVVERFGDASRDFHVVRDVVRDEILSSWQRSVGAGLRHDLLDVPYDGDVDDTGRLVLGGGPRSSTELRTTSTRPGWVSS